MITLSAKVDVLSSSNGTITATSNVNDIKNNISVGLSGVIEKRVKIEQPFLIGVNVIGDESKFADEVNYFVSRQFSNGSGKFEQPIEFTIYGDKITAFTLAFDTKNNRYPTSVVVDGNEILNDDTLFTASVTEANEHTVKISNWNAPNTQMIISGMYIEISIDINFKNLLSMERSIFDRGDLKFPSWGIISNVGKLEFVDTTYEVKEYAEQRLLKAGSQIQIYLNNTIEELKEHIGTFYADSWEYDSDSRKVTVSLKDDLEEWQNILLDQYTVKENKTMYDLYKYLVSKTPKKWEFALDVEAKMFLEQIVCPFTYLESGNLWAQWDKLCKIAMLHIYKSNENKVVVKHFM